MFRCNTISIRFSYFGNPNWTKKPSGIFFCFIWFLFVCFWRKWRMEDPESSFFLSVCRTYIFFYIFFFRLGIPRARISIVGRTRTGTESGGYCWRREWAEKGERAIEWERERREKKNHADEKQQILTRHHSPLNSSSRIIIMKKKKKIQKKRKK